MDTIGHILKEKGSREVFSLPPTATALQAAQEMCTHRIGALLVREGDMPVGIVSERDLMVRVLLAGRNPAETPLGEVMTKDVVCVNEDVTAESAMAIMTEKRFRHLPVVHQSRITGLVSIGDLVRWASRNQEFEIRMLTGYICGTYPG